MDSITPQRQFLAFIAGITWLFLMLVENGHKIFPLGE